MVVNETSYIFFHACMRDHVCWGPYVDIHQSTCKETGPKNTCMHAFMNAMRAMHAVPCFHMSCMHDNF